MSQRKILFFDIDGTLIDEKRIIPEDCIAALREAKQNGHILFINSGRVNCNIEGFIRKYFDGVVAGCGTEIIYQGEVLHHHRLPKELCIDIAYKCREYGMQALFEYSKYTCYDKEMSDRNWLDELLSYFRSISMKLVDSIEDPDFIFDKFASFYDDRSDLAAFREYIAQWFTYIDREGNFCELEPIGYSKASGIAFLLDYFGLSKEDAYVFGDSNNDIEMMRFVPNSIAMGNGSEECKQTASFITKDIHEGGIAFAMKHFGLIKE